jgi:hypothetical protein
MESGFIPTMTPVLISCHKAATYVYVLRVSTVLVVKVANILKHIQIQYPTVGSVNAASTSVSVYVSCWYYW